MKSYPKIVEVVPSTGDPVIPVKFVSHCFFLTHKCLILGLTQTIHLYRDIGRMLARVSHTTGVYLQTNDCHFRFKRLREMKVQDGECFILSF